MDFSILTVVFNQSIEFLEKNIISLCPKNKIEFIIVDNSVNNNYFKKLQEWHSSLNQELQEKVKIIQSPVNGGYSKGINIGFKRSIGKYLLLSNPDIIYDSEFFNIALKEFQNPKWGIVGPKILRSNRITVYSGLITQKKYSITDFSNWINFNKADVQDNNFHYDTFYAPGGCLLIRRELFKKLKGFDENFFMYTEETDLCERARKKGHRVVYSPRLIAILDQSFSQSLFSQKLRFRNNLLFFGKNYSSLTLFIQFLLSFPRLLIALTERSMNFKIKYSRLIPILKEIFIGFRMGLIYLLKNKESSK